MRSCYNIFRSKAHNTGSVGVRSSNLLCSMESGYRLVFGFFYIKIGSRSFRRSPLFVAFLVCHAVAHADLGEDVSRLVGIGFDFAADVGHMNAEDFVVA